MIKLYIFYFFILVNYAFAQENSVRNLDSISIKLKGKSSKQKCLFFLEKAEQEANTGTNYSYLYSHEALKEAILSKNDSLIGLSYIALGSHHQVQTQLDSCIFYYKKALIYSEKRNDTIGIAESYTNIGMAFDSKGNFEKALKFYYKALTLYEKKQNNDKIAMTMVNIGIVYKTQKDYKKAYFYYKKANEIYEKLNSEFGIAATSGNLGAILINFKSYNRSLKFSNKSKDLYEKLGFKGSTAYAISNIAVVYDSLHQFEEANKNYLESINLYEKFSNNFEVATICDAFSKSLINQQKYAESIVYAEKALQYAHNADAFFLEVSAFGNLAKAYGKMGVFDKAYYYANSYNKGMERIFKTEKAKAVFELEVKYESEKKSKLLLQIQNKIQQRNTIVLIVSLMIVSIGLISFLIYRQQKTKSKQKEQEYQLQSAIVAIETQNKLEEQRITISRDLHDNIGAQLTFIVSSINNIKHAFELNNSKLENKLQLISTFTKATIAELRDTIWAMNCKEVSFKDLRLRIFNFIEKAKLAVDGIDFRFIVDKELSKVVFGSVDGMNLYRVVQEAIHNSIKYAQATEIEVSIVEENDYMLLKISDNGIGFEQKTSVLGNGILNMKKRIKEVNGTFDLVSESKKGTTITIKLITKRFEI
jgi:signal transduction histidine kinase